MYKYMYRYVYIYIYLQMELYEYVFCSYGKNMGFANLPIDDPKEGFDSWVDVYDWYVLVN